MWKWLRRIRGAIGMSFTWAVAWVAVGFVPRWVFGIDSDLPFPLLFGGLGFIAGLLVLTEGRRRFHQMSLPRFAGLGAIGGLLLSALFVGGASLGWSEVLAIATTFALACAVSAWFPRCGQASGQARTAREPSRARCATCRPRRRGPRHPSPMTQNPLPNGSLQNATGFGPCVRNSFSTAPPSARTFASTASSSGTSKSRCTGVQCRS